MKRAKTRCTFKVNTKLSGRSQAQKVSGRLKVIVVANE